MPLTLAGRYVDEFVDRAGRPVPNVSVTVYETGTVTKATLYTDRTKSTTRANPVSGDEWGNVSFFADPGDYDVEALGLRLPVMVPIHPADPAIEAIGGHPHDELAAPLRLRSSFAGGYDTSDSTSRLTIESYQTNGQHFFGEGVRLDLRNALAKNMLAWRLPRPPTAASTDENLRSVTWIGAHYYAQDQPDINNPTDVHGHFSIEVPDAADALRTRLEIKFVKADGSLGVDKTLVQTANADLVVDCSNNQVLRLRSGAGQAKLIEYGNGEWGTAPRWTAGQTGTAESGANAGSDFELSRHNDAGARQDAPLIVTRSNGKVTLGGANGTAAGVQVNRASAGVAQQTTTNFAGATGAIAHGYNALDATSRFAQINISSDGNYRLVIFADGKHEWGAGAGTRDVNLYRKAADQLATDDALFLGNQSTPPGTPTGGGVLYVESGALRYKGSSGTVTSIAPA